MTTTQVTNGFAEFFAKPYQQPALSLADASLLECLDAKIKIRQRISKNAYKQYSSLTKSLREIEQENHCTIMPTHINEVFWSIYIQQQEREGKQASTIKTMCSQLRALIEWSAKYNAKIDSTYANYRITAFDKTKVALTPDDISRIYHHDLSGLKCHRQRIKTLEKVRDQFCLMCNVGLRYSDARRLKPENIRDGIISILQQKTKRYARIDIKKMSIHQQMTYEILNKYNNQAPYDKDITDFNKALHELIYLCNFEEQVKQEQVKEGIVTTSYRKKGDMITSHTARRTFVVCNANRGLPVLDIMRATGHRTYEAFQKYLCYGD